LFRGNSIATKAMEAYMKLVGEKVGYVLFVKQGNLSAAVYREKF